LGINAKRSIDTRKLTLENGAMNEMLLLKILMNSIFVTSSSLIRPIMTQKYTEM